MWSTMRACDDRQGGVMTRNTVIVTDATFEDDVRRADRPVIVDFCAGVVHAAPTGVGAWAAHAVLPGPGGAS
jgi:hypothetical protein